jgi:hypothetical protein
MGGKRMNSIIDIKFSRNITAKLRNGYINQSGIQIYNDPRGHIELSAFNSNGKIATGYLNIPKENLIEFIETLKEMV